MEKTLEQEFMERVFIHQTAILGGALMNDYIERETKEQSNSEINLPEFMIKAKADKWSNKVMAEALQNGTFKVLYEKAWADIAEDLPENFSITAFQR